MPIRLPEVVERDNAVSAFLAERQTEDTKADHSSRVGQIVNGDIPHPENQAADPEKKEPVAEPAKDPEGTAEAKPVAKPDEVTPEAEQKADLTGKETPTAEEEPKPSKSQKTRAARELRMRTSIQAEADATYRSEIDTLKSEIVVLKAGKPAEPAAAAPEQQNNRLKTQKRHRCRVFPTSEIISKSSMLRVTNSTWRLRLTKPSKQPPRLLLQ